MQECQPKADGTPGFMTERCRSGLTGTPGERVYAKAYREFESLSFRKMYFVYVLWSDKLQKRYVGFTSNLSKRLAEHNSGKTPFTKTGMPWEIIYTEEYSVESEARLKEKFLKSGVGRKFLDTHLRHRDSKESACS